MLIKGLKKTMPHVTKQAAPITPGTLMILSKVVNCNDQIELLAWAAVLWGFHVFLHISNLVPHSMLKFQPNKQFMRQDITITSPEDAMMFEVR